MSRTEVLALHTATVAPMLVLPWSVPVWTLSAAWWLLTQRNDATGHSALLALTAPSLPFVLATGWVLNRLRT